MFTIYLNHNIGVRYLPYQKAGKYTITLKINKKQILFYAGINVVQKNSFFKALKCMKIYSHVAYSVYILK